jgi:hypothetical protein
MGVGKRGSSPRPTGDNKMTQEMKIADIAVLYGVAVEDVAVRVEFSTHLSINQKALCGIFDNNKYPELRDAKMITHLDSFGHYGHCKSCLKIFIKKAVA